MKYIDKPSSAENQSDRKVTLSKKIKNFTKYHVDVLGNAYPITREKLKMEIDK